MTIGVVAHIRIKPGLEARFEAIIARHAKIVRETEPGNKLYQLFRSRENPSCYTFMEIYKSDEALELHRANTDFDPGRAEMAQIRDGLPTLTVFDAV